MQKVIYDTVEAQNLARALTRAYDEALEQVDVLLMPTIPMKATPLPGPDTGFAERIRQVEPLFERVYCEMEPGAVLFFHCNLLHASGHNLSAEDPRHPTELVLDKFPGFGIGTFVLRPQSRGSVHISSADPDEPPVIAANYLATLPGLVVMGPLTLALVLGIALRARGPLPWSDAGSRLFARPILTIVNLHFTSRSG